MQKGLEETSWGDLMLEPWKWLLGWGTCPVYDTMSSLTGLATATLCELFDLSP